MRGKLLQQARLDAVKFATAGGFEEDILLKTNDGVTALAVKGLTTGHAERFDNEGNAVISSSVHITFPMQSLIIGEYPFLNSANKVALTGHKVEMIDVNGINVKYVINEVLPNKTTGLIVCILGLAK